MQDYHLTIVLNCLYQDLRKEQTMATQFVHTNDLEIAMATQMLICKRRVEHIH